MRSRLGVHGFLARAGALNRSTILPVAVVAACTLTMIIPASLLATMGTVASRPTSGSERRPVRVDVRGSGVDLDALRAAIEEDPQISRHAELVSTRIDALTSEGQWESLVVEHGHQAAFPLRCQSGRAPSAPNEIALSHNEAAELGATVGDPVRVRDANGEHILRVVGTYQDVTNGGRTAKRGPIPIEAPLWRVFYLDVPRESDIDGVVGRLREAAPGARVTPIGDYTRETMGATTAQLERVAWLAAISGTALSALIVALFAVLVVVRERAAIAALKAVGASERGLIGQYTARFAIIGLMGAMIGALGAGLAGRLLMRAFMGGLGAPGVVLLPNPWISWFALPVLTLTVVVLAARAALGRIRSVTLDEQE